MVRAESLLCIADISWGIGGRRAGGQSGLELAGRLATEVAAAAASM